MAPIIQNRMGDVVQSVNEPVAANQTIRKGDLIKYGAGNTVVKAAIGDTGLLGVAEHAVTTGGTVTEADRLIVSLFLPSSEHKGTLKNGTTYTRAALVNQAVGFIDEGGEIRLDLAAAVKQAVIVEMVERGVTTNDPAQAVFKIVAQANRVR